MRTFVDPQGPGDRLLNETVTASAGSASASYDLASGRLLGDFTIGLNDERDGCAEIFAGFPQR
jgi:hypothetical protein